MFSSVLLIGNFDLVTFLHTCGGTWSMGPCP